MYFIDFKVCNKESYEKIFLLHKEEECFIDTKKNLLYKLESKSLELALCTTNIFKLNCFKLYNKGLGILIYALDVLKSNSNYDQNQVEFVEEWIKFLLNQAKSVFKIKDDDIKEVYECIKDYFINSS